MKYLFPLLLATLALTGCVHFTPEQQRAHTAPLRALPEIVIAATTFRLQKDRWPRTKEEIADGFEFWRGTPEYLSELETLTVTDESANSVHYHCLFRGAGSANIRVNLQ